MNNSRGINTTKIASEQYIERLKDIATAAYFDRQVPYNEEPSHEAQYGHRLWGNEQDADPWELLAAAVVSGAVRDYVLCCIDVDEARDDTERYRAERERAAVAGWFQQNEFLENIFEVVDRKVAEARRKCQLRRLCSQIRWCM